MENVQVIASIESAVRYVAKEFARFSAPNKLPPKEYADNIRRIGDIDIFFDFERPGVAVYHFVTWDNIEVSVGFDFTMLDREYMADMMRDIQKRIDEHRGNRDPLVINVQPEAANDADTVEKAVKAAIKPNLTLVH
jgi:hypothetical protein